MGLAELILDENIDQVSALNTNLEVIAWNKSCELATGISKKEIIGKKIFSLFPEMEKDQIILNSFRVALMGFKSFLPHGRSTYKEGHHVERHFVPLKDEQEAVIGILIITHDVAHRIKVENELKVLNKSLENFKLIIDSAHDTIITFDVNGYITYWNNAAEKLYGYHADEIIGNSLECLLPDDRKNELAAIINSIHANTVIDTVVKRQTKHGNLVDVAVNIFPLIDENNKLIGGCKIARDITEILNYQKNIETLNNELVVRNRQLASLNSELKTFNHIAVNNYSETLRQLYLHFEYVVANEATKLSDPGKANIRKAQAAIQKMKLLTEDIIAFTRLNEFDTEVKPVDLNVVMEVIVEDLKENIKAANAELTIGELPAIQGYPFLVSLVFHHLLDNAIKFRSEKEQPRIEVSAELYVNSGQIKVLPEQSNVSYHAITIRDNGIGFAPEEVENIFQIFTRLHPTRYKGSGVGLAICRKAMERHGGFIITESIPGEGSSFTCFFPA